MHLRIYSGSIKHNTSVYNITQDKELVLLMIFSFNVCFILIRERISRLLLALADEHKEVKLMSHGNIAVVAGLKHVRLMFD